MRAFNLPYRVLSEAFWRCVFEATESRRRQIQDSFFSELGGLDDLRKLAQYNTGSISTATQWALFSLACYWRPKIIAEVGTFIGKSAIALAKGCDVAGEIAEVHTCDFSNKIDIPRLTKSVLIQYQGTASGAMFQEMLEDDYEGQVQLMHLDGRLTKEDLPMVGRLMASDGIIVLDDFEGVEKGVANVYSLKGKPEFERYFVIYPPSRGLLESFGLRDSCGTCVLLPHSAMRIVPQA